MYYTCRIKPVLILVSKLNLFRSLVCRPWLASIFIGICLIFIGGVIYFFVRSRGNKKSFYWPITSELDTLPRTPAMRMRGSSYKSN